MHVHFCSHHESGHVAQMAGNVQEHSDPSRLSYGPHLMGHFVISRVVKLLQFVEPGFGPRKQAMNPDWRPSSPHSGPKTEAQQF